MSMVLGVDIIMSNSLEFQDWSSLPGETILEIMEE